MIPFVGMGATGAKLGMKAKNAFDLTRAARTNKQALQEIYEYTAASGKTYIGQSKNISSRLQQHIKSGKLLPGTPVKITEVLGGIVGGVTTPKSHSWMTGNPHRTPVSSVSELSSVGIKDSHGLSKGEIYKGKITSEVNGDFQQAMKEWNSIQKQYGFEPSQKFPNGFEVRLGNGSTVTGNFYSGGIHNPNGFTIKIFTYLDKAIIPAVKKIPPVYIRY